MSIFFNKKILDKISFDLDTSTFILSNDDLNDSFNVSFVPNKVSDEYDPELYDLFIFENKSLDAENDIFLVNESNLNKGIGWIFPLSTLESNDNDFSDLEWFNQFRYLAYQKLLSTSFFFKKEISKNKQSFVLSDLFDDDMVIFIISHKDLGSKPDIHDYLPSLANHGYYLKNEFKLKYKCPNDIIVDWYRGKKKINIRKAINPVYKTNYSRKLYTNYLKSFDHHLIRFHLIYQFIENHLSDLFNDEFERLLDDYNSKNITKNNFIESINNVRNERKNIRRVLNHLKTNSGTFEDSALVNLKRDCREFLDKYKVEERNEIGDLIYDVRNLFVHNYSGVEDDQVDLLNEIIFGFEVLINRLMIFNKNND